MFYIIYFIAGLFFGSFFYVVGTRGSRNENYVTDKSRCDHCKHELKWYELIPLFSFILQKGKCNYCHKKINSEHFYLELVTGFLFLLSFILYDNTIETAKFLVIISLTIIIFISDFKYMVILDIPLLFLSIVYMIILFIDLGMKELIIHIISGFALSLTLFLIKKLGDFLFKKDSMGGGDIKLAFFMGLVLNYPLGLCALTLSSFLALPYAFAILTLNKKNELPFGPFLISACVIIFIFLDKFNTVLEFLFF